jgi:DNA mismatch repair protein MutS
MSYKINSNKTVKETPLMKQYNEIKSKHPSAILLFRVGDFYETFGEDAIKVSKILNIVLTKKSNGSSSTIELAGFPYHALDTYLPKLIKAGYRVAICDQLEDASLAKGIVKRGITELVTPGLSYHDEVLDKKNNNYLASIHFDNNVLGIAFIDISTGEFSATEGGKEYIGKLIESFNPAEIIYSKPHKKEIEEYLKNQYNISSLEDWIFNLDYAYERLNEHFNTLSLKGFGINNLPRAIIAAGAILRYLEETQHTQISHIRSISRLEKDKYVWLDKFTIKNLELIQTQQEGGTPLIEILDKTITPMGARLIRKWLLLPLKDEEKIKKRLKFVEVFVNDPELAQQVTTNLKNIGDLERLSSKISTKRINPRELLMLKRALYNIPEMQKKLQASPSENIITFAQQIIQCDHLLTKLENELHEDPPINTNQGSLIKQCVYKDLDSIRKIAYEGKEILATIQKKEIQNTGISSLKIAYNKIFGYYLEVPNTHKNKVPNTWIRKQTLSNAERYTVEELKEYEEKILTAQSKICELEQKYYNILVERAAEFIPQIQYNARLIAEIDCYISLAQVARRYQYAKPKITADQIINIKQGRHPVIEQTLPIEEKYIPNDTYLDRETNQISIITGPNMAGKSALLRQVALLVIMSQMGSYIPVESASIGVVDKIFTRVGASDNLAKGESTFMVEMTETASIVNNLSENSLIIMDEIGRGTSTYDGISIAWALVEYLHRSVYKPKTLFATHYHELNQLENYLERVKNFNVTVKEIGNKIIFVRKLESGGSQHSFGINVAKLAGMPKDLVEHAQIIMNQLSQTSSININQAEIKISSLSHKVHKERQEEAEKLLSDIKKLIEQIDINTTSPLEALLKLKDLKHLLKAQ